MHLLQLARGAIGGLVLVVGPLVLSSCGDNGSPASVASLGSTTTTAAPTSPSSGAVDPKTYADDLSYAKCMRAHGLATFPDPNSEGVFLHYSDRASAQYLSADTACKHLLPNGGEPTAAQLRSLTANGLRYTDCMRAHGIANYPDPKVATISDRTASEFPLAGLDPGSSQFQKARTSCESDLFGL